MQIGRPGQSSNSPPPITKELSRPRSVLRSAAFFILGGVAAAQAAARGVRVYAIGFGTEQGAEVSSCGQRNYGFEPFGGASAFGGGGGGFRRGIDEETLIEVAEMTGAEYYSAESAGELERVFRELPTSTIMKTDTTEVTGVLVVVGGLLLALALMLSLIWHPLA